MLRTLDQLRPLRILKVAIALTFCLALLSGPADATERQFGAPRTSFAFSDKQFEKKVSQFLDVPYKLGGNTRKGMDCSAFSKTVYSQFFGLDLPRTSLDQYRYSALKKIDPNQLQPGDLIFFANKKKKIVNHVGVYISKNRFIHASSSQGVTVSSLDDAYWRNRFMGSKRHSSFTVVRQPDIIRIKSEQKKQYRGA